MQSLKLLGRNLKRANRALRIQNSLLKKLEAQTEKNEVIIKATKENIQRVSDYKESVTKVIRARQDPKNAIRCALPKRIQRERGLLKAIDIITK